MIQQKKRYHPFSIIIDIWDYIKGAFVPALFLFILNHDSDMFIWKYGRYLFMIITSIYVVHVILKWLTRKYALTSQAFHLYQGIFVKEVQTVPFNRIQNNHRKTSVLHRLCHMTSLQFETAMSGENATVIFKAVTTKEANHIEEIIAGHQQIEQEETPSEKEDTIEQKDRMIHFTPTKKDTIRAFFTSFNFLILVPILLSFYSKIDDLFDIEKQTEGIISMLLHSWWMIVIVIILTVTMSISIGIIRIYIKYGKYEISSDDKRIYITQGVLSETSFSIKKKNVQAIEVEQSLMKRLLHIVEIKLVSAGNVETDDDDMVISSLYPFLKKTHAYDILSEILPDYQITEEMTSFPKAALWLSMLKGNVFSLIPLGLILYFQPTFWGITLIWWGVILTLLFLLININIWLNYRYSAYAINKEFIQYRKGAFGTSVFLSKREKIIEVSISNSGIQKMFGIASLKIVNRSHPVSHTSIDHVPIHAAKIFYDWYLERANEITLDDQQGSYH